jgi:hypothetical protein
MAQTFQNNDFITWSQVACTGDLTFANGLTVRQILNDANTVLGGGPEPNPSVMFQDMFALANSIDMSFNGGTVSTFATQHFVYPVTMSAPEIDPVTVGGAATLLIGALAVVRGRRTLQRC